MVLGRWKTGGEWRGSMILGVCYEGRWLAGLSFSLLLLIPNPALDVGVVSREDTYYIYIAAAEAGGDRSR